MVSKKYWIERYKTGGTSGAGSYGRLAHFKADFINSLVRQYRIYPVCELGCGDGNQLGLYKFNKYTGYDVNEEVLDRCSILFPNYDFIMLPENFFYNKKYDLTLSVDVIYHLLEEETYEKHMLSLFMLSQKYVVIYSTNNPEIFNEAPHIKHRKFSDWVELNRPDYYLKHIEKNRWPYRGHVESGSECSFYVYEKRN